MKLKAVLEKGASPELVGALESPEFRAKVISEVLGPHLKVQGFGPAEFYIQECDFAVGSEPMCEVRLTGVSVNRRRSTDDFHNARTALELLYLNTIRSYLTDTKQTVQLMVSIMLDKPPQDEPTSLVEGQPRLVTGPVAFQTKPRL